MQIKYTHPELDKEVPAPAGYYIPEREERIQYRGREVLCIIGQSVLESSCCGMGRYIYALVPGYIVSWQGQVDENGAPVSEVETISDSGERNEIRQLVMARETVDQVDFL